MVMAVEIAQLPVLSDNYIYLVHDPESRRTAVVDPAVGPPVLAEAARRGWQITDIWNTHWHPDHTGANLEIKEATGARSEEHTSELQSLMRISYAVFCLKKKKKTIHNQHKMTRI